ncbi:site-2 protease family protein [Galbitalea sp. SE-J8]|uniref:M50 family metallopeptidase n=1 Tax=Galbitalea sp. SE-J8 TaxID=3054952 RepID=UPI00259CF3B5|nr:site-2 protease family protein [Galbitalea sp. SE-J8]MDM4763493.1 site-2 protease family protein [Galbitalea sp. SE-J8]
METVLLYIVGILIIVVGLALSIGLHELGHLVPAKRFGVRVGQYMIGFGPTIFSRRRGETEYGVKAIPLGGYISMAGMYPPKDGQRGEHGRDATTGFMQTLVQDAPVLERAAEDAGEVATTVVVPGGTVEREVELDDPKRSFYNLAFWKRIVIMLGGPAMNLVIGIVLYAIVLCGFGIAQSSTTIGSVSACVIPAASAQQDCTAGDAPAPGAEAGIRPGDRLVSMNGTAITSWAQATKLIRASAGTPIAVVVERDGADVDLTATPLLTERYVYDERGDVVKDANGDSETERVGFLGIGAATEVVQQPITAVLPAVGENVGSVVHIILNLPQRLVDVWNAAFGSAPRDPNGPVSVVGVGRLAGEIASINTVPVADRASALIGLLASLNIALFVFNLIPLLPLDGGHVAGALIEAIRRGFARLRRRADPGPIDITKALPLTMTVVIVLGAMSALLVYADIVKPISVL